MKICFKQVACPKYGKSGFWIISCVSWDKGPHISGRVRATIQSRYGQTLHICGKNWAILDIVHGVLPAMRVGWTLFCLFFWSIVIHWIILPNMSRINRLWHMPKLWPGPTSICIVVFFLVFDLILEWVNTICTLILKSITQRNRVFRSWLYTAQMFKGFKLDSVLKWLISSILLKISYHVENKSKMNSQAFSCPLPSIFWYIF